MCCQGRAGQVLREGLSQRAHPGRLAWESWVLGVKVESNAPLKENGFPWSLQYKAWPQGLQHPGGNTEGHVTEGHKKGHTRGVSFLVSSDSLPVSGAKARTTLSLNVKGKREAERRGRNLLTLLCTLNTIFTGRMKAGTEQFPQETVNNVSVIAIRPSHFLCQLTDGELKEQARFRSGNSWELHI